MSHKRSIRLVMSFKRLSCYVLSTMPYHYNQYLQKLFLNDFSLVVLVMQSHVKATTSMQDAFLQRKKIIASEINAVGVILVLKDISKFSWLGHLSTSASNAANSIFTIRSLATYLQSALVPAVARKCLYFNKSTQVFPEALVGTINYLALLF